MKKNLFIFLFFVIVLNILTATDLYSYKILTKIKNAEAIFYLKLSIIYFILSNIIMFFYLKLHKLNLKYIFFNILITTIWGLIIYFYKFDNISKNTIYCESIPYFKGTEKKYYVIINNKKHELNVTILKNYLYGIKF